MLEGGTFVREYGSRQETVNLDDARGIGLWNKHNNWSAVVYLELKEI